MDEATSKYLLANKSPSRKCGEPDNRSTHFYIAMYWAQALASQSKDAGLASCFSEVASSLEASESKIMEELIDNQGKPMEIGGYYQPDVSLAEDAMRPSEMFNAIIDGLQTSS